MILAGLLVVAAGCVNTARSVLYPIDERPVVASTPDGDPIVLGGFSGLAFLGVDDTTGVMHFTTHTDRGPNAELVTSAGGPARPFALPGFQPELVMVDVDPTAGQARIVRRIGLVAANGATLTGLPPAADGDERGDGRATEIAVDLRGAPIEMRGDGRGAIGVDLEGLARGADGSWWMCDEYQPAILRFDGIGRLLERWVPHASTAGAAGVDMPVIPALYAHRIPNRGFEGIAVAGTRLHAFLQGPLAPPDMPSGTHKRSRAIRVPVFDVRTRSLVAEHVYLLESPKNKVGDAAADDAGAVLVLETGGGGAGDVGVAAHVYRVDASSATDLLRLSPEALAALEPIEARSPKELAAAGIVPLHKTLVVDCGAAGYGFARKPEGLAVIDATRVAIVNDDDFGLAGAFDPATGRLAPNPSPQPVAIAVFEMSPAP